MPLSGPLLSRDYLTTLPFSRLTKLSKPMGALTRYITVIQEEGTLVKGAREKENDRSNRSLPRIFETDDKN